MYFDHKNKSPFIIAELSGNHNGSINNIFKLIDESIKAGADAIKIQTYSPDTITLDSNNKDFIIQDGPWKKEKLYDLYKKACTPYGWHKEIFSYAKKNKIKIFSSPFSETDVDFLEKIGCEAFKIASFEITHIPLIEHIAKKKKPILISTGMATKKEIEKAIVTVKKFSNNQLIILHCVSGYPSEPEEANLNKMTKIYNDFNVDVGLSDHSLTHEVSVVAVSMGAKVVEKHITLDRSVGGVDSKFSLEPKEFQDFVKLTKNVNIIKGNNLFSLQKSEKAHRKLRRSIYVSKDIDENEVFTNQNIKVVRPGLGLAPSNYSKILGKKSNKKLFYGQRLTLNDIKDF